MRRLVAVLVGGAATLLIACGYFWWKSALAALVDIVFGFNMHYAKTWATSWSEALGGIGYFASVQAVPATLLVLSTRVLWGAYRRSRGLPRSELAVEEALMWLCAFVAVAMQRKFFSYHWGILLAPVAISSGVLVKRAFETGRSPVAWALAFVGVAVLICPDWTTNREVTYLSHARSLWQRHRGELSELAYLSQFRGGYGYDYACEELVGRVLRARHQPGDEVVVDGFEPAIYQVSGMLSPTRFPASHFLDDPRLRYERELWLKQHDRALRSRPPRFLVSRVPAERTAHFAQLVQMYPYVPVYAWAGFLIYDRLDPAPAVVRLPAAVGLNLRPPRP